MAARAVLEGRIKPEDITAQSFGQFLYTAELPDPDLLIRTSGEIRVSNFLLWQCAYAEFVFVPECWPDFTTEVFDRCLETFAGRERRFGAVAQPQVAS
jgi:undecaprenyl diphosphate synthase